MTLKLDADGNIVSITKRPAGGQFVLYYQNGRAYEGLLVEATRDTVVIRLHYGTARQDETIITKHDGPWEFAPPLKERIGLVLGLRSERCGRTRESIYPKDYSTIILQCVKAPGHKGGCIFENPDNGRKR